MFNGIYEIDLFIIKFVIVIVHWRWRPVWRSVWWPVWRSAWRPMAATPTSRTMWAHSHQSATRTLFKETLPFGTCVS